MIKNICIAFAFLLFWSCKHTTEKNVVTDDSVSGVWQIDTVYIDENEIPEKCFLTELSYYPALKGDWNDINTYLRDTSEHFIENSAKMSECDEENMSSIPMGWAKTSFDVLSNTHDVVSISLNLVNGFGGGNMWLLYVKGINIDTKTKQLIPSEKLRGSKTTKEKLNEVIYRYFKNNFPEDAEANIGKNYIEDERDFESMEYGIRNDSLMLLLPAFPGGHVSYTIYTIPIDKLN